MVWLDWQWGTAHQYAILGVLLPILGLWLTVRTLWKSADKGSPQAERSQTDSRTPLDSSRLLSAWARLGMANFILLGVLPAIVFFKLAHDDEMRLFVQQQIWGFAQSLEEYSQAPWRQVGIGDTRQNFQYLTGPRPCLIPGCQVDTQTPDHIQSTSCVPYAPSGEFPDLQYILQGLYVDLSFPICLSLGTDQRDSGSPDGTPWLQMLHQLVRKSSLQNPMNQESYGFIHFNNQASATQWSRTIEGNDQAIILLFPQFPEGFSNTTRYSTLELQATAPLFPWNLGPVLIGTILIGILLLTLSYGLLRYATGRIFPMSSLFYRCHAAISQEPNAQNESLSNLLILGPPGSGKSAFATRLRHEWERFDLHTIGGKEAWAEGLLAQVPEKTRAVVVDHFEYQWEDPAQNQEKRAFIKGLLSRHIKVCIMSSCNPFAWDERPSNEASPPSSLGPQGPWTDLFHTFGLAYFIPNKMEAMVRAWLNPQASDRHTEDRGQLHFVKRLLKQETEVTPHLGRIGNWIRSSQEWWMWSPEEMKEQLRLAALPYYRSLWESCSVHEKLALYHVASEGYLHTHNPELTALCQKGLLRLNPDIQLLNESFRSFVLEIATKTRVAEWEGGTTSDTWARLKYPFLLVFGVIVIFLFATQQEFKNSFITLISLLPVLLPALPELPLLFSGQKSTNSSSA